MWLKYFRPGSRRRRQPVGSAFEPRQGRWKTRIYYCLPFALQIASARSKVSRVYITVDSRLCSLEACRPFRACSSKFRRHGHCPIAEDSQITVLECCIASHKAGEHCNVRVASFFFGAVAAGFYVQPRGIWH